MSASSPLTIRGPRAGPIEGVDAPPLIAQPIAVDAVGIDRDRRVVGHPEKLPPELAGRTRHVLDRRRPIGVGRVVVRAPDRSPIVTSSGQLTAGRQLDLALTFAQLRRHPGCSREPRRSQPRPGTGKLRISPPQAIAVQRQSHRPRRVRPAPRGGARNPSTTGGRAPPRAAPPPAQPTGKPAGETTRHSPSGPRSAPRNAALHRRADRRSVTRTTRSRSNPRSRTADAPRPTTTTSSTPDAARNDSSRASATAHASLISRRSPACRAKATPSRTSAGSRRRTRAAPAADFPGRRTRARRDS